MAQQIIRHIDQTGVYTDNGPLLQFKTHPFQHQITCLSQYALRPYYALLADMGTGKTWIAINNFAILYALGRVKNMLVIAPNGVQWNWVNNELPKHLPDFEGGNVGYAAYSGSMKRADEKKLEALLNPKSNFSGRIFCVNWDALSNEKGRSKIETFLALEPSYNMIVLDESDYAKEPTTLRAKGLMKIAPMATYRRIMTGTPITNSPLDAFVQFEFLNKGLLGFKNFFQFTHYFSVYRPVFGRAARRSDIVSYRNLDELTNKIAPHSFMIKKEACLTLPEKVYSDYFVTLTPFQQKVYDLLVDDAILKFGDVTLDITNRLTLLTHLCQCTGNHYSAQVYELCKEKGLMLGPVIDDNSNPKLDALLGLVNIAMANNDKVLVWARFKQELRDIMAALSERGIKAVEYHGEVSEDDRKAALIDFQKGDAKVFVGNPQSAGTGLTLTSGNVVVYYSNSFSLHDRLQSEDRCHRIGQNKQVIYINLIAKGTVDEKIQRALNNKQNIAKEVLDFPQQFL